MIKMALSSFSSLFFAFAGILGIGLLITIHEFGHFIFCKLFNVKTPSFSIGFGPRLISKKIGDTVFSLSAIPLGGYVEIAGSAEMGQGDQKEAHVTDESSFATKPYWQKITIMLGGISFNLIFAYLVFISLFWIGLPKTNLTLPALTRPVIESLADDLSPARDAGLLPGDHIISLDGIPLQDKILPLMKGIGSNPGKTISFGVERNGELLTIPVTLGSKDSNGRPVGLIGVAFVTAEPKPLSFFAAVPKGIWLTNLWIKATIDAFTSLFKSRDISQVAGTISIFSESMKGAAQGLMVFLLFLAIISINLAILNLIPIPIFDGGQVMLLSIEAVIRRTIPLVIKEAIFTVSWLLIIALILFTSFKDVTRMVDFNALKKFFIRS
jgi:regulator of sigma E protease